MGAPIYLKIKEELLEEIQNTPVNTPITSERELASRYGASRMTVRNAINELVEEGILYRDKNKGTFVADQKLVKKNTSAEMLNKEEVEDYDSTVIYFSTRDADEIAPYLEIREEDKLIRIVRLNKKLEKAQSVEEIYYIRNLVSDMDVDDLNKLLNFKTFINGGSVTQRFLPVTVPIKYINLLHVKLNTPIIMVESTIFSKSGSPVVYIREYNNPFEKTIEITT